MNKIIINYWKKRNLTEYEHGQEMLYSVENVNLVISEVLDKGLSIMLRPNMGEAKDQLVIIIDEGRFTQS